MAKRVKEKQVIKLKKGATGQLDAIYDIQGLAGGDWWDWPDGDPDSDCYIVTKDVHFTITVYET